MLVLSYLYLRLELHFSSRVFFPELNSKDNAKGSIYDFGRKRNIFVSLNVIVLRSNTKSVLSYLQNIKYEVE